MVTYGDQEQEFALAPTYDAEAGTGTPGEYAALVIPTAPGDYTFHVTGTVEGVKVDLEVEELAQDVLAGGGRLGGAVPGQGARGRTRWPSGSTRSCRAWRRPTR